MTAEQDIASVAGQLAELTRTVNEMNSQLAAHAKTLGLIEHVLIPSAERLGPGGRAQLPAPILRACDCRARSPPSRAAPRR